MSWEMPGAGQPGRQGLEVAFEESLRRTSSFMHLMSQAAAERIGINPTDLNCLNILSLGGKLTAGQLAQATGLTTASITGVVDRLEEAGYVRRERDAQRPPPGGHPPDHRAGAARRRHGLRPDAGGVEEGGGRLHRRGARAHHRLPGQDRAGAQGPPAAAAGRAACPAGSPAPRRPGRTVRPAPCRARLPGRQARPQPLQRRREPLQPLSDRSPPAPASAARPARSWTARSRSGPRR